MIGKANFKKSQKLRTGAALVSALFIVAATTVLVVGGAKFVLSHNASAMGDADYASALQLAEAGLNYELWYISRNGVSSAHALSSPYSGSITGVTGTYTVGISNSSGGTWSSGQDMYITATGTVGRVSRKLTIKSTAGGTAPAAMNVWGTYSLFAVNSLSITNDLILTGSIGSNGPITITSGSNFRVSGTIDKCGSASTLTYPSWYQWDTYLNDLMKNRVRSVSAVAMPTVDDEVALAFPGQGWAYLKDATKRANGKIKMYKATYTTMPTATANANWDSSVIAMTDANIGSISAAANGGKSTGMATDCTLVFPPGDYYFESWSMTGNKRFIIDNANGPVRIWMNSANANVATTDTMAGSGGNFYFTGANPAQGFRFYYNKNGTIDISGNNTTGGFYAVNAAGNAKITNSGSANITGSVIANYITFNAAMTLTAPSYGVYNTTTDPGSPPSFYGFDSAWTEKPVTSGGVVFSDGTSN